MSARRLQNIKRVAIVGGGPFGVAAAKFLRAENAFETIDIFEQRGYAGGLWNYVPQNDKDDPVEVPKTFPDGKIEHARWRPAKLNDKLEQDSKTPTFSSPMYELLEANLCKMLMQHSDVSFSEDEQLFPKHESILEYLERYADDVRSLIKFEVQVTDIDLSYEDNQAQWNLTSLDLRSSKTSKSTYDAILIAIGHYSVPFVPDYPGIRTFNKNHPQIITHAKRYRHPADFSNKKVLVVGTGPSGMDIIFQLAPHVRQLLISSRADPKPMFSQTGPHVSQHPAIAEFLDSKQSPIVRFADGTTASDIDAVLFATGYIYTYPFLPHDTFAALGLPPLITDGERVLNVYQHIFYTAEPTLAFGTLPWNIVPFPVSESQGATVARVWSGRLEIPSLLTTKGWEDEVAGRMGTGKAFHKLPPPQDVEYINSLYAWCATAEGEAEGKGRKPPYWNEYMRWLRVNAFAMKGAYAMKGEDRHKITTLEQLGFRFEDREKNGHSGDR